MKKWEDVVVRGRAMAPCNVHGIHSWFSSQALGVAPSNSVHVGVPRYAGHGSCALPCKVHGLHSWFSDRTIEVPAPHLVQVGVPRDFGIVCIRRRCNPYGRAIGKCSMIDTSRRTPFTAFKAHHGSCAFEFTALGLVQGLVFVEILEIGVSHRRAMRHVQCLEKCAERTRSFQSVPWELRLRFTAVRRVQEEISSATEAHQIVRLIATWGLPQALRNNFGLCILAMCEAGVNAPRHKFCSGAAGTPQILKIIWMRAGVYRGLCVFVICHVGFVAIFLCALVVHVDSVFVLMRLCFGGLVRCDCYICCLCVFVDGEWIG